MQDKIPLELLLPAKDLESGQAAIRFGADAVYIGGPAFSARKAASNSIQDIEQLIKYARGYHARVYAALNTIIHDSELEEARLQAIQLAGAGVDALIIQDFAFLQMDLPAVPLFASTQMHNHTPERVKFLEEAGFSRVILARELTPDEIFAIREQTSIALEAFVHGALCVSYSGQCYFSQAIMGRSANRGECAQPCRSSYDLLDSQGNIILKNKHVLSMKDLDLSSRLIDLVKAGVTSFKVEGRLKDIHYIKNSTALYRRALDAILEGSPVYSKSSSGRVYHDFTPDASRTFSRGYTGFFVEGRQEGISSMNTQKSIGARLGSVLKVERDHFVIKEQVELANGDGICFYNTGGQLTGGRVNKMVGQKIYPSQPLALVEGMTVYRNADQAFQNQLKISKTTRVVDVSAKFREQDGEIRVEVVDEDACQASVSYPIGWELSKNPARSREQVQTCFSKTGDTIFRVVNLEMDLEQEYFIPVSVLNQMRREVLDHLLESRLKAYKNRIVKPSPAAEATYPVQKLDYRANVLNSMAREYLLGHGVKQVEPAYESRLHVPGDVLMTTRYCTRYELGLCGIHQNPLEAGNAPLFLTDGKRRYKLVFRCKECQMQVILDKSS